MYGKEQLFPLQEQPNTSITRFLIVSTPKEAEIISNAIISSDIALIFDPHPSRLYNTAACNNKIPPWDTAQTTGIVLSENETRLIATVQGVVNKESDFFYFHEIYDESENEIV